MNWKEIIEAENCAYERAKLQLNLVLAFLIVLVLVTVSCFN
jgi:hypothetical protein